MPKLNFANKSVRDYLLAVPNYWAKKANIDGWRLDVPNEVATDFWPQFRAATKKANPQSWIVGEIWGDGGPWLKGDMFDSVMGYQFRSSTQQFIAEGKLTPTEYLGQLTATYASYAPQVARNLMNLLSSHDTERFITLCGNDPAKHRLAAFLQFTWVGTPSVYYGEELGMTGGKDPENRKPMEWNRVDGNEMLSFYRSLIAARNNLQALQSGIPVVLDTNDKSETLAFARVTENQCVIAAANRSDKPQTISLNLKGKLPDGLVNLHEPFMNLVGHSETQVSGADNLVINLPPKGVCLLAPRKNLSRLKRGKETEPVKSFVSH
jgi:glycosidase